MIEKKHSQCWTLSGCHPCPVSAQCRSLDSVNFTTQMLYSNKNYNLYVPTQNGSIMHEVCVSKTKPPKSSCCSFAQWWYILSLSWQFVLLRKGPAKILGTSAAIETTYSKHRSRIENEHRTEWQNLWTQERSTLPAVGSLIVPCTNPTLLVKVVCNSKALLLDGHWKNTSPHRPPSILKALGFVFSVPNQNWKLTIVASKKMPNPSPRPKALEIEHFPENASRASTSLSSKWLAAQLTGTTTIKEILMKTMKLVQKYSDP